MKHYLDNFFAKEIGAVDRTAGTRYQSFLTMRQERQRRQNMMKTLTTLSMKNPDMLTAWQAEQHLDTVKNPDLLTA